MRRQASLGSEDAANIKQHLPRQSVSSPERDDAAKNQTSPPLRESCTLVLKLVGLGTSFPDGITVIGKLIGTGQSLYLYMYRKVVSSIRKFSCLNGLQGSFDILLFN